MTTTNLQVIHKIYNQKLSVRQTFINEGQVPDEKVKELSQKTSCLVEFKLIQTK